MAVLRRSGPSGFTSSASAMRCADGCCCAPNGHEPRLLPEPIESELGNDHVARFADGRATGIVQISNLQRAPLRALPTDSRAVSAAEVSVRVEKPLAAEVGANVALGTQPDSVAIPVQGRL